MDLPENFTSSALWPAALDQRATIAAEPAVYVLQAASPFGRLSGSSRILYIGHTQQFGGTSQSCRLRIYRYPNGAHAHGVRTRSQRLIQSGIQVSLHWILMPSKTDAAAFEAKLLQEYLAQHGELPPFNSRC